MAKLGLIAGGGALPLTLAAHCQAEGRELFVIRLRGFADPALAAYDSDEASMGEIGRIIRLAKHAGCEAVCLAGAVHRPDLRTAKVDFKGAMLVPGILAAAKQGDEGLLRFLTGVLEKEGFGVEGAHEVMGELTLAAGPLGRLDAGPQHAADVEKALHVARAIGALDVGQGAVVCDGLVLAVEAQEGTDALLRRVAELPSDLRGTPERRRGVLAKAAKPIQDDRVDMPTIGVATVEGAARAGLAGIVGAAGKMLVVDQGTVAAAADAAGIFVVGVADAGA